MSLQCAKVPRCSNTHAHTLPALKTHVPASVFVCLHRQTSFYDCCPHPYFKVVLSENSSGKHGHPHRSANANVGSQTFWKDNCGHLTHSFFAPCLPPPTPSPAQHAGKPPSMVAVPTHYFKVVLSENSSGKHGPHKAAVGAFVMPNAAIDPATPVTAFTVPLEALESVAGGGGRMGRGVGRGAGEGETSLSSGWVGVGVGGAFVMPNAAIDPAPPVTAFTLLLEALESVAGAF